MASIRTSTTDLSHEEYVRIFEEAYDFHMPPYDFRVWDLYLFSRCSEEVSVLGLFQLFAWPLIYLPGTCRQCIETVGQWCLQGTFIDQVKNVIERQRHRHFDPEQADLDLAFIEEHQAFFKNGPMQLSTVGKKEQDAWRDQAKACILSKSPRTATPVEVYTQQWFAKQEAYFAFGVLAWNIRQDPGWANEDPRLDVWYKLGFSIATQKNPADELLAQYEKYFSFKRIQFEYFFFYWSLGKLAEQLQVGLKSKHSVFWGHLTKFHKKKITEDQGTVFRLYQVVSLRNDAYIKLMKTRHWGVFEKARKYYILDGFPDTKDRDAEEKKAIIRKLVFSDVLGKIEHPMALHWDMKRGKLREFITKTYEEHDMELSNDTLNIACCNY